MHRQPLLQMLDRYLAAYPDESSIVERIRKLVKERTDCFDRSCRPGHVTGSAWILSHDRRRCLLVHHRKLDRWLQPGGHADGQADVEQVALREAEEETGLSQLELFTSDSQLLPLDVDVHLIPARLDANGNEIESAHEHHDIRFLLVAAEGEQPVVSHESNDIRWFTQKELLEATNEESVLRMQRKAGPKQE